MPFLIPILLNFNLLTEHPVQADDKEKDTSDYKDAAAVTILEKPETKVVEKESNLDNIFPPYYINTKFKIFQFYSSPCAKYISDLVHLQV